jgi:hypothetical protein
MTTIQPACATCIYLLDENLLEMKIICEAFPDGIPDEIFSGKNDHSKPLPSQKNTIVFEPVKTK